MIERKEFSLGILLFIVLIIVLDIAYLSYLTYFLIFSDGYLTTFLSFSIFSIVLCINVLLTTLSLVVIPYGFIKRKNWARLYAVLFLTWFAVHAIGYIILTGEKIICFLFFIMDVLLVMYLLMSSVERYFKKSSLAIIPSDICKEYRYGDYTLYSKLVQLKNAKIQKIYFFSKRRPKSGTPALLPIGFEVEVNKRSGLPYLKKG